MVVAALLEMDDRIKLRHGRRLLRRGRYHADIALPGMKEQMGPAVTEQIFSEAYFRALREDGVPSQTAVAAPELPQPTAIGASLCANNCPRGEVYFIPSIAQISSDTRQRSRIVHIRPAFPL